MASLFSLSVPYLSHQLLILITPALEKGEQGGIKIRDRKEHILSFTRCFEGILQSSPKESTLHLSCHGQCTPSDQLLLELIHNPYASKSPNLYRGLFKPIPRWPKFGSLPKKKKIKKNQKHLICSPLVEIQFNQTHPCSSAAKNHVMG